MRQKPNVSVSISDILTDLKAKCGDVALIGDHSGWHVKIMRWTQSTSNAEKASNEWQPVTIIYGTPELAAIAALKEVDDALQPNKA